MRVLATIAGVLAAACLCGCALGTKTVSHSGAVGEALSGPGGLKIQPVRYLPHVRGGHRLAAFLIHECVGTLYLPTIGQQNFDLRLRNGAAAPLVFPEEVFSDDLDLLGEPGCEQGHIVFRIPAGERPAELRFALSWSTSDPDGNARTTKVRFAWKV
jgi:hypothetical protein